jgi:hypothetical protein
MMKSRKREKEIEGWKRHRIAINCVRKTKQNNQNSKEKENNINITLCTKNDD